MFKIIVVLVLVFILLPSVIGEVCNHFYQKKLAKNKHKIQMSHNQMASLLQPEGKKSVPVKTEVAVPEPVTTIEPKPVQQTAQSQEAQHEKQNVERLPPHEVQTIVLRREFYY